MAKNKITWSVIVMCFNEAATLERVVTELKNVLQTLCSDFEIIIVDDFSQDGSREIARELALQDRRVLAIEHPTNLGIGEVLRSGYQKCRFSLVTAVPADGQFDPKELLSCALPSENEFVMFYRKDNLQYSLTRNVLSWINKCLNQLLFGVTFKDVNWVKIYPQARLKSLDLSIRSSLVESEICIKLIKQGIKPIDIESTYLARVSGVSKGASWKIVRQAVRDILTLWFVCLKR